MVMTPEKKTDKTPEVNAMTDRVKYRLAECNNAPVYMSADRAQDYMKSWDAHKSTPRHLRRAMAFADVMRNAEPVIRDGELIVSGETKYIKGAEASLDFCPYDTLEMIEEGEFQTLSEVMYATIEDDQLPKLKEAAEYWVGQSVQDYVQETWRREMGEEYLKLLDLDARVIESVFNFATKGPSLFNPRVLTEGFNGIKARAEKELEFERHNHGTGTEVNTARYHKMIICEGIIEVCDGIITFAKNHAALARKMAKKEKDAQRKKELEQIAERCDWVPANPARTFAEGMQSILFTLVALKKEEPVPSGASLGRFDQFMYPLYKKDIEEGRITPQEAAELIGLLYVKFNEFTGARAKVSNQQSAASLLQQITLGGVDKYGRDTTNELSYLTMEVARQMKTPQPGIYIRWHQGIDHEFMIKAVETTRDIGGGIPAFLNDPSAISRAMALGISADDAYDWAAAACLYWVLPGANISPQVMGNLNLVKMFEIMLYNGFDPRTKRQLGPKTGDPRTFTTIEQFNEAWETQFAYFLDKLMLASFMGHSAKMEMYTMPVSTTLLDDAITRGLDGEEGGQRYPQIDILYGDRGHVDVADSLAAIKKLVLEDKKLTMDELIDALSSNFEGKENIRQMLLQAPKYGNDDDYVDDIFNYVSLRTGEIMMARKNPWTGKPLQWQRPAVTGHYYHGAVIGAMPNGRKAWTPIADANFSASGGADVNGPTAMINSATKVNHFPPELNGAILNMKFSPAMLKTRESIERFLFALKTFFDRGGWHIQFNIVNRQDLVAAQKNPEKWRNLTVRVGGYSAYFVELPRDVQNEIIARTEHTL